MCSDMGGRGGVNGVNEALNRAQRVVLSSLDQPPDSLFASASSHSFLERLQVKSSPPDSTTLRSRLNNCGSRGMLNFGAVKGGNRLGNSFFQSHDQDDSGDEFMDEYFNPPEKKRRLSVQQVQFLEKSFDADNKLEPDRKVQLAKELSLLPRQIAIWFQNRRARWKARQLEADYEALHANYESLKTEYDNILKENEKLKTEVLCLKNSGLAGGTDKVNRDSESNVTSKEAMADMFCEDQESKASKNEEQSSTKSDFNYVESPLLAVGIQSPPFESGDSSYDFDISHSDLMQNGEDEWKNELYQLDCLFSKIEGGSHCLQPGSAFYYGFQVEDQCFSLWS